MKFIVVLLVCILTHSGLTQDIKVADIRKLATTSDGDFYFPRFTPDGDHLVLTKTDLKGLWLYRIENETLTRLNDYKGAGYQPVFLPDRNEIVYRTYEYQGPRKYYSLRVQNLESGREEIMIENLRRLNSPVQLDRMVAFMADGMVRVLNPRDGLLKAGSLPPSERIAYYEDHRIVIYENGQKRSVRPFGDAVYVWVSLSPDRERLLFTHGTEGTFIAGLDGEIISALGPEVHAPRWSPDGQHILYMQDEDDGHVYTASDLFMVAVDGGNKRQLTETEDVIEMHPEWGPDGRRITFHSTAGEIYLMTLEWQ